MVIVLVILVCSVVLTGDYLAPVLGLGLLALYKVARGTTSPRDDLAAPPAARSSRGDVSEALSRCPDGWRPAMDAGDYVCTDGQGPNKLNLSALAGGSDVSRCQRALAEAEHLGVRWAAAESACAFGT